MAQFEKFVNLNKILPLSTEIARESAKFYAELGTKGQTVGHNDVLIAGTAIVHDLTLITNNTRHFAHILGLDLDNWTKT